jgi:hypothetical protein
VAGGVRLATLQSKKVHPIASSSSPPKPDPFWILSVTASLPSSVSSHHARRFEQGGYWFVCPAIRLQAKYSRTKKEHGGGIGDGGSIF